MSEISRFLAENWFSGAIGIAGLAITLLLFVVQTRKRLFYYHSTFRVSEMAQPWPGGEDVFLSYRNRRYSALYVHRFAFWNPYGKTIVRSDVARRDPLTLSAQDFKIVRVEDVSQTREAIGAKARRTDDNSISIGFEFLDKGDGFVIHCLSKMDTNGLLVGQAFKLSGSIQGMPQGVWRSISVESIGLKDFLFIVSYAVVTMASINLIWESLVVLAQWSGLPMTLPTLRSHLPASDTVIGPIALGGGSLITWWYSGRMFARTLVDGTRRPPIRIREKLLPLEKDEKSSQVFEKMFARSRNSL